MLRGLMMDRPLSISSVIDYAAEIHPNSEIVSATVEGGLHRTTYREIRGRIAQLAHALVAMGIKPGDRVATVAWNGYRHFELYFAISGIGAVCHTINPRLPADQIVYIVNHASDRAIFFDLTFAPLLAGLRSRFPADLRAVVMTDRAHAPDAAETGVEVYEDLLAGQPAAIEWPEFDENAAAGLCYTSGTTGEPKGVLYSHRSNVLHALSALAVTPKNFGPDKRLMPVVPLFHANAWGLPYSGGLSGTSFVMPGAKLDGPTVFDLMDSERVDGAYGVPTVWLGLLSEMRARGRKPTHLSRVLVGGSAAPRAMIAEFERDWGIEVVHGWGMTEMSPVGTLSTLEPEHQALPFDRRIELKSRQGRRNFNVEMKLVGPDGQRVPHDGEQVGELFVRGPFIASGYFNNPDATRKAIDEDGWFSTGDVAKITPDGFLILVDRAKDLVKSGGEWISSIDLENIGMAHPAVAQCAVIGVPHPKWDERPLLIVVLKPGTQPRKEELLSFIAERVAKWQVPDDVVFMESLPLTATGKVSKLELRKMLKDYVLPNAA